MLIVVIAKRWLSSVDEEGRRRLANSDDFVRLEIGTALRRDIRVIPVLVELSGVSRRESRFLSWFVDRRRPIVVVPAARAAWGVHLIVRVEALRIPAAVAGAGGQRVA